ncbi:MAG: hypothetical protein CM1200mP26_11990 [Acidimicrobiales bacterium]|nr:MAG: hypothetical protein CM1200mP26_11990 [Acidimicrobiales bacterium]
MLYRPATVFGAASDHGAVEGNGQDVDEEVAAFGRSEWHRLESRFYPRSGIAGLESYRRVASWKWGPVWSINQIGQSRARCPSASEHWESGYGTHLTPPDVSILGEIPIGCQHDFSSLPGAGEKALAACVNCGLCLPHCPTYRVRVTSGGHLEVGFR